MPAHEERVKALLALQGADSRERHLLDTEVLVYDRWETKASGGTYLAILADDTEAFHKSHSRLNSVNTHNFGHSRDTPPLHECAAWQFARALGEPYERLLPPTVYRVIEGEPGSLALRLRGSKPAGVAFTKAVDQVNDAGFFDVLIGQQDRHLNNFLWDAGTARLGLIDHGFCFPKDSIDVDAAELPRHRVRSHQLVKQRRFKQIKLTDEELTLIQRVLDSGDLLGIEPILEPERAAAMKRRLRGLRGPAGGTIPKLGI